jgi:hypothetical protein
MANISYSVTRWDVQVLASDPSVVTSVTLGISASDSESGISAYKDERISVPNQNLTEFEASSESFIEGVLGSQGWFLELQTRIANQMTAPVAAPEDRTKPDFSAMTIGDGYQDLPSEESSEEESSEESTEEAPAEEESSEEESGE